MDRLLNSDNDLSLAIRDPSIEDVVTVRQHHTSILLRSTSKLLEKGRSNEGIGWYSFVWRTPEYKDHIIICFGVLFFFFQVACGAIRRVPTLNRLTTTIKYTNDEAAIELAHIAYHGFQWV